MSRRVNAHVVTLLLAGSALLVPQPAQAGSGGAATSSSHSSVTTPTTSSYSSSSSSSASGVIQPGNLSVSATGDGITIATRASALLRAGLRFTGRVPSPAAGQVVEVERRGHQTGWSWAPTAHGTVKGNGAFSAYWPANHIGRFQIRAVIERAGVGAARAGSSSPSLTVTVYRPAITTQYGSGSYGSRTACGEKLTPTMLGVANRTLRCGTAVAIYYHGRTITVPVIDRGPYANGADWDLTEATGRKLGIDGTATIGAVSLPAR